MFIHVHKYFCNHWLLDLYSSEIAAQVPSTSGVLLSWAWSAAASSARFAKLLTLLNVFVSTWYVERLKSQSSSQSQHSYLQAITCGDSTFEMTLHPSASASTLKVAKPGCIVVRCKGNGHMWHKASLDNLFKHVQTRLKCKIYWRTLKSSACSLCGTRHTGIRSCEEIANLPLDHLAIGGNV